jgi:transcriptional regulator with GAF, ATPase, and Fis domain
MSSSLRWERERDRKSLSNDAAPGSSDLAAHNLNSLREAAITLLREVESLTNSQLRKSNRNFHLHEEVQRYEIELIRRALQRTGGNQRRAARLLGVKVTTLNCKIKRFGITLGDEESDMSVLA